MGLKPTTLELTVQYSTDGANGEVKGVTCYLLPVTCPVAGLAVDDVVFSSMSLRGARCPCLLVSALHPNCWTDFDENSDT